MYDAIVVGARCAGASTAMLLARKGHSVLLVDRATFPSDIPHGHLIHMQGPRLLSRWGLLERVLATGAPPITTQTTDAGDFPLTGTDLSVNGVPIALGPRRTELDQVLIEAAIDAGAELRERFAVLEFVSDGDRITGVRGRDTAGGTEVTERASVVVGADGRNSRLAHTVDAPVREVVPTLSCWYFSYWSGVSGSALEIHARNERAVFAFPTNDGLFAIFASWPIGLLPMVKANIEGEFMKVLDGVPQLGDRVRVGRREERFYGATQLPNFLRKPYGPGWALVGDAGCHKDPFMALGVCDALRDAELLADALGEGLSGELPMEEALAGYERARDEQTMAWYQINLEMARLGPPAPEQLALRAALRDSPEDTNLFYMARDGMVPPETFFNPENMQRLMAKAPLDIA
jgi:2-polyprenyl-6-methoxyphenol hydroxylase-like FAD-dependent oxidoreductase